MLVGIVQRYRRTLEVETELGKGSTFRVRLPFHPAARVCSEEPETEPEAGRGLRVLPVDDEPALRQLIDAYLRADGHAAEVAESGEDALERFRDGTYDTANA